MDDRRDLFGACSAWSRWRARRAAVFLLAATCCLTLTSAASPAQPARSLLAWCGTFAMGGGALFATAVHFGQARIAWRGALMGASLVLIPWAASGLVGLPSPWQAAGIAGLWCLGMACVPADATGAALGLSRAGFLVLLALVCDGAASGWGLFLEVPPWPPGVAARLLDLSPRTFVMEIAGFDWMRDPSVYESVGTDRIPPSLRPPYGQGAPGGPAGGPQGASAWRLAVAVLPVLVVGSITTGLRLLRSQATSDPR